MDFEALQAEFAGLDAASLCDVDRSIRVMDGGLRPVRGGLALLGFARTVSCGDDFLTVLQALHDAVPGEVLIVDPRGSQRAVAGEMFATEAHRRGLAGIVIDGACRDTRAIRELPMPVWSRSFSPLAATSRELHPTQGPITCGGVIVLPGEIVFGDDDGIVVLDPVDLPRLLPAARDVQRAEQAALQRMHGGESLFDFLGFDEHAAAIRAGEESKLRFR